MLKEKTKIVEVSGVKYQLNKMDSRTGSYVAAKIALLCAPMLKEQEEITEEDIAKILPNLNHRDFDEMLTILLKTVYRLNGDMPEPVCKSNGVIFDQDLAYDVATVIALAVNALMFNVGGFFSEAGFLKPAIK